MYFTVYKITNNLNHKIYIGAHKSKREFDSYYGSGKAIKQAIKKYGKQNFTKEILFSFVEETLMWEKESELVNFEFISRIDTYNQCLGGKSPPNPFLPGYVSCKDKNGNYIAVPVTDTRYISGELQQVGNKSGIVRMIHNKSGEHKDISVELINQMKSVGWEIWSKGFNRYKDSNNNCFYLKTDDPKIKTLNLSCWSANKAVMLVDGVVSWVDVNNISADMRSISKDFVSVKDNSGKTFRTHKTDPRYVSGEVVGVNKGKIGLANHLNSILFKCEHCGKELTKGNFTRWHGQNCKNLQKTA
jgi:hypothetical protein